MEDLKSELESRLYFYSKNLEDILRFMRGFQYARGNSHHFLIMVVCEYIISLERIDSLLSEYAYYYPYN